MPLLGTWKPLKSDFKRGQPLAAIPADWLNTVANIFNGLMVRNMTIIRTVDGRGWTFQIGDATDGNDRAFSVKKVGDSTLLVRRGYCRYAAGSWVSKSDTELTVSASGSVYVTLEYSSGTFSDPSFADTSSVPLPDDDTEVYILADIAYASSEITAVFTRRDGDIVEPRT